MAEFEEVYSKFKNLKPGEVMEIPIDKLTRVIPEDFAESPSMQEREEADATAYPARDGSDSIVVRDGHHGLSKLKLSGEKTARIMKVNPPPPGEEPWNP